MNKVTLQNITKTNSLFDVPYLRIIEFKKEVNDPCWEERFCIGYGVQTFIVKSMKNQTFTIELDTSIVLGNQGWDRLNGPKIDDPNDLFKEAIFLYRKYVLGNMHEDFLGQCKRIFAEKPIVAIPSFWRWNEIEEVAVMGLKFEGHTKSTSNPLAVIGYNFAEGRYIARVGFKGRTWTEDSDSYSKTLTGAGMALKQIFYGYF